MAINQSDIPEGVADLFQSSYDDSQVADPTAATQIALADVMDGLVDCGVDEDELASALLLLGADEDEEDDESDFDDEEEDEDEFDDEDEEDEDDFDDDEDE